MDWVMKSVISTLCFTPFLLLVGFFSKNFAVKPEVTLFYWLLGVVIFLPVITIKTGMLTPGDFSLNRTKLVIIGLGAVLGVLSNVLLSQALPAAPNPGLPMAIINCSSIIAFILAVVLASVLPKFFNPAKFEVQHFAGIIITIIGVAMICWKR